LETGIAIECKFQNQKYIPKHYSAFSQTYPQIPIQLCGYNPEKNETWIVAL